ncbi:hypothetical protein [Bacillus halotolerans]|uniref:hypothetical protein n=1 Tax=Bacillus halotolerans TaxID=260554 RepID=UPI00380E78EF
MDNDIEIVKAYASLWNSRSFSNEDAEAVTEAIDLELLDKRTHPRLRKPMLEKYYAAIQRIVNSQLEPAVKYQLVKLHTERVRYLKEERGEQL